MEIDKDAYLDGLRAGLRRVHAHFPDFAPRRIEEFEGPLRRVLQDSQIDAHPRFITLFVELWAVAEIARSVNQEPRLNEKQIQLFLDHTVEYINSFIHR